MTRSATRATIRLGAALAGATVVGVLAVAAPAFAHVSVTPDEAVAGERARLTFRVPTESDTASTVGLEVHFPEEAPISSVSTAVVPGWNAEVTYRTLDEPLDDGHGGQVTEAVEMIAWTADDPSGGIPPGQFGEFAVSLGPLPDVDELAFPTLQTYSDGNIVRWIDLPQPGIEAERPAPLVTLTAASAAAGDDGEASDGNGQAAGDDPAGGSSAQEDGASAADPAPSSGAGTWLGAVGLVAGLAGLAMGAVAFRRTRPAPTSTE